MISQRMRMAAIAITASFSYFLISAATATFDGVEALCRGPPRQARFHVYVQDIYGEEPNATVWTVAQGKWPERTDTHFGEVRVIDGLLTAGTSPNSQALGRIQGMVAFSDFSELSVTMNMNFYFTTGRFKGSSLVCLGRNPMAHRYNRDLPIVGGTGKFLNARGYTISNTVYNNPELTYHILEYYIYVVYEEVLPGCLEELGREDGPFTELF